MVISKKVAAAGLTVAIGAFAPCAFAQAGGEAGSAAAVGSSPVRRQPQVVG
jgi:hypothetical protein